MCMNHFHPTSFSPEDDPFFKALSLNPRIHWDGGREGGTESFLMVCIVPFMKSVAQTLVNTVRRPTHCYIHIRAAQCIVRERLRY